MEHLGVGDLRHLVDVLKRNSGMTRKGIRFIYGSENESFISYQELFTISLRILSTFQAKGVKPKEEMLFQCDDIREFICNFWACILGGIIPVPVSVGNNHEHRLKVFTIWKKLNNPYLLTDGNTLGQLSSFAEKNGLTDVYHRMKQNSFLVGDQDLPEKPGMLYEPDPEDTAFIQFSSGSTGSPKGVVLTHANLMTNIGGIHKASGFTEEDSILSWMPLTHDMGLIGMHLTCVAGKGNNYILPTNLFIRNPILWMDKLSEHKATITSSPNFGYKYLLSFYKPDSAKKWDLSYLRIICNGAEPISAPLCYEFSAALSVYGLSRNCILPSYGMAEACVAVTFAPLDEEVLSYNISRKTLSLDGEVMDETGENSINFVDAGYPVDHCLVRICDFNNNVLGENHVGRIQIKGKNVTKGYYNDEEATSKVITEDGWLITEDLGFMRNSRLIVTGREKDIIFVNGKNYYSHDIERVSEAVEGVELGKVAVCAFYNELLQRDMLVMFVVHKKDLKDFVGLIGILKNHILTQVGIQLDDVIPVKRLPKTTSGKVKRFELAQRYINKEFHEIQEKIKTIPGDIQPLNRTTEETLLAVFKEAAGVEHMGTDDNFIEIGGNSLLLTTVYGKINEIYPKKIVISDMFAHPTISRLARLIDSQNVITLPMLKLPKDYFYHERLAQSVPVSIQSSLGREIARWLSLVAQKEKVEIFDILLSLYIFLLSEVTQNNEITIQVMTDFDHATSLSFDIAGIEDLGRLFALVTKCRSGAVQDSSYSLKNIDKISLRKDPVQVLPLFGMKDFVKPAAGLNRVYDVVMKIHLEDSNISVLCEYDGSRMKKEEMNDLVTRYIKLIMLLIDEYDINDEGVAI